MSLESATTSHVQRIEKSLFSTPRQRTLIYSLLLVVLVLALYNPVVHNGFINIDDNLYVTDNATVKAGLHWATVKWAFVTFEQANWHPLTWIVYELDWQLFKKNAAGHHYTGVLFHALDVVLLFLLFQSATGYTWRSLFIAAIFAVHPANVESVAWVSELKNVLSMAFFLLAMLAYTRYARRPSVGRYLWVPFLFALGLMAKPQVITLPFVLLLWDYWPLQRFGSACKDENAPRFASGSVGRLLLEKVPLLALAAADALVTIYAQHRGQAIRSLADDSAYERVGNAIISYARYIGHAFWPYHLSPTYSHAGDSISLWWSLAALLLLLCLTALVLLAGKRYALTGWLWFLGTLVPMIGLVQVGLQSMADRYTHIPFIGLFWIATWFTADAASRIHSASKWMAMPACLLISICCFLSHQLLGYWHDSETLWNYAVRVDDNDFLAHANLGRILVAENRPDEGIRQFMIAERLHRYPLDDILTFVTFEIRRGLIEDARERSRHVLAMTQDPRLRAIALTDLGIACLRQGEVESARPYFEQAKQAEPNGAGPLVGFGLVALRTGDVSSAVDDFSRAVAIRPTNLGYYLLAVAYAKDKREAESRSAYEQAQRLSVDSRDMNDAIEWAHQLLASSGSSSTQSSQLNFVSGR